MLLILQIVTVFLVAVSMSMALAHAVEFPGKLRLDEQAYRSVQTIYYPGFTFGGIGEALAVVATLILMLSIRHDGVSFWWAFSAFVAIVAMQAVFWFITQPTNRYWLKNQPLSEAGTRFFALDRADSPGSTEAIYPDWNVFEIDGSTRISFGHFYPGSHWSRWSSPSQSKHISCLSMVEDEMRI